MHFHPAVTDYFTRAFGAPTPPQARGWPSIQAGEHTLIAAPTGSGKTLAGFLASIDALVRDAPLPDETRVLYVSPLKALSNDIEKNLKKPLAGIDAALAELGLPPHGIRVGLRTGDTPASERLKLTKRAPHIFVTTPESLYIMLTSESGRRMLKTVRAVIVDEIHATIGSKRGAHLALSLERLDELCQREVQRIGLSATQRPIELVARFLAGAHRPPATIVDEGHARAIDLTIEMPASPLEPVMSHEVWDEVEDRLAQLISEHTSTLVFVNTRRMAERLSAALEERLGENKVLAHHGSLSREVRLHAEERLKSGALPALVATASLELGIDIGEIDLVCQVGSPRAIAALLQRVGRSGHFLGGTPKGRLFPTSRDDLVECLALLECTKARELDHVRVPEAPLDVLAQQMVAIAATGERDTEQLFALARRALPYQRLAREDFDAVLRMLSSGFSTRRGRRSAHVHFDAVSDKVRARRGAGLIAMTCGGAIPETTEYAVVQQPEGIRVGSVHEDFAIESYKGDIFQLGTTSWRILRVLPGTVFVEDARGEPPTIPFWVAEAPGRTTELSRAVMRVMKEGIEPDGTPARDQAAEYLTLAKHALGELPSEDLLVAERFFDEAGNTHLVIHSRFGARINRAWGLALRKSFCRSFNFELQAAATDDAIILSLGPTHSFPLEEVFTFLKSKTAEKILVQAALDAPVFGIRWRWASTISLAVPRMRGGKKIPPKLQQIMAEDLLTVVFPDAQACLENVVGDREVPDHPLVKQALADALREAMDVDGLVALLERIERGEVRTLARDLTQPSHLAAEILGAKPYAFLDDAPLEERRTQAVMSRRFTDIEQMGDLAALDPAGIALVCDQAWPDPKTRDEVHDALVVFGFLTEREGRGEGHVARADLRPMLEELARERRATLLGGVWVAAERLSEMCAVTGARAAIEPAPGHVFQGERVQALTEIVRSRLEGLGPVTPARLCVPADAGDVAHALALLEVEGFAMRGRFTRASLSAPSEHGEEWCERRLLARIHRATLDRLRREIEPVSLADLVRFYFAWQRATPSTRGRGITGLEAVLAQLEGFEAPAAAWEREILPARLHAYEPAWLDALCVSGRFVWARGASAGTQVKGTRPIKTTPITLVPREHLGDWERVRPRVPALADLSEDARRAYHALGERGALFLSDVAQIARLAPKDAAAAVAELTMRGVITNDSFAGLRGLLTRDGQGGRWTLVRASDELPTEEDALWSIARALLRRWGIVFRRLLDREAALPPWRDLVRVYRRLEGRGEIRGGRFVTVHSGEQFALPEAIGLVRELRRKPTRGELVTVSAVDPLALMGSGTTGDPIPSLTRNRVAFQDGIPVAARVGDEVRFLTDLSDREPILAALEARPPVRRIA